MNNMGLGMLADQVDTNLARYQSALLHYKLLLFIIVIMVEGYVKLNLCLA